MTQLAEAPTGTLRQSIPIRFKAAGIHLGLSGLVFAVALYLILVRWYPGFHFTVDGGWQGVRIMALVDLVLGPFLTLIIFNPFKARRLIAFDLTCIGIAQLAALAWGFHAVHGQKPASINFYGGVFYSMPVRSVRAEAGAAEALARLSDRDPALVFVAPPQDAEEARRAAAREERKLLAHEDATFFRALAPHWPQVLREAVVPEHSSDTSFKRDLPAFLARHGGQAGDYRFFRYQGGYGSCMIAFTPAGEPVDALGCEIS